MKDSTDLSTKEAFEKLVNQRKWYLPLGISASTAGSIKQRYLQDGVTINKMEEILEKCGYRVVQEKRWRR